MGLFSRHKKETVESQIPVAPPLPPIAAPKASLENTSENLVAPIAPTSMGLDDIKSQVTLNEEPKNDGLGEIQNLHHDSNLELDDNLFDFSDIESSKNELSNLDSTDFNENGSSSLIDTNIDSNNKLSFVESGKDYSKISKDDTYFVTTSQFKSLLEIVESVKDRVKNSSESHLRLLDLKSEEDIEYENLRKDFQFIEDKLYELDSIIFEK